MSSSDRTGAGRAGFVVGFATTHWSAVLAAGDSASPETQEALDRLCRTYWYPLYAFVRANGYRPKDAEDLTQAFFERFIEKRYVKAAIREKGRFRTFLMTLARRFLCNEFDRATAAKRGGGVPHVPLDTLEAEGQLDEAVTSSQCPESTFDRAWAETVIQTGLDRLRVEYEAHGKAALFGELKGYLSRPVSQATYAEAARRLSLSSDAVVMAVLRLRRRYRAMVRAEVANTVATPAEIDEEMRYLVDVLTRDR